MDISLREINQKNVAQICALSSTLSDNQRQFVVDNAYVIACSNYNDFSWIRAVYLDEDPAGLIELYDRPEIPEYMLWRFMIAGPFQGKGLGKGAIHQLVLHVRTRPDATELVTSFIEGDGNPGGFYQAIGFQPNGKTYNGETGLSLKL